MILDITKSGYQKGYLPKDGIGAFHPFFATANAAFRRDALKAVGGFDTACRTGEDLDLSIRIAQAGYELWFQPEARVIHLHRQTLIGLLEQWFGYGMGHPYLFRKHNPRRRLQFFRYKAPRRPDDSYGVVRAFELPVPVYGMIFLSAFHLMHLFLLLAAVLFAFGLRPAGAAALVVTALYANSYFGFQGFFRQPGKMLWMSGLRYLADAAYVLGGFLGGIRQGVIFFEATRFQKTLPLQESLRQPKAGRERA